MYKITYFDNRVLHRTLYTNYIALPIVPSWVLPVAYVCIYIYIYTDALWNILQPATFNWQFSRHGRPGRLHLIGCGWICGTDEVHNWRSGDPANEIPINETHLGGYMLGGRKIAYFTGKSTYSNRKLPYIPLIDTLLLILIPSINILT